jgi:hypothetical protein
MRSDPSSTDAGQDLALRQMPVTDQPLAAVSVSLSMTGEQAAPSASTACANNVRAPLRSTSVSGSAKVPS